MKIRSIKALSILALPLAAMAVAAVLLSMNLGTVKQASAAGPVDLSLSIGSCKSHQLAVGPKAECNVSAGSTVIASFNVDKAPAGGYSGYDLAIAFSGNINFSGQVTRPANLGPACGKDPAGSTPGCFYSDVASANVVSGTAKPGATPGPQTGNGTLNNGAAQTIDPVTALARPNSTYTGSILTFRITCKDSGDGILTLKTGPGNTTLAPPAQEPEDETLLIHCVPATATPLPTATNTPPPIPRVFKEPVLQNIFLLRQGAKIPPPRCDDGSDVATLTEQINQTIATISPKGEPQTLAAFEFEVRFDPTKVCVNLVPSAQWQALIDSGDAFCFVQDKDSSTLEGIARIGCVTQGKGFAADLDGLELATIEVRPQPELYSQLRPNQDNGNAIQILNQACELADEQGHAVPIFSCEDADITFRYLEGDVDGPDCDVDVLDAQQVAFRWGVNKGSLLYNSFMDLEPSGQVKGDGDIDIKDIQFVFGRFGSTCAVPHPAQPPVNPKA